MVLVAGAVQFRLDHNQDDTEASNHNKPLSNPCKIVNNGEGSARIGNGDDAL